MLLSTPPHPHISVYILLLAHISICPVSLLFFFLYLVGQQKPPWTSPAQGFFLKGSFSLPLHGFNFFSYWEFFVFLATTTIVSLSIAWFIYCLISLILPACLYCLALVWVCPGYCFFLRLVLVLIFCCFVLVLVFGFTSSHLHVFPSLRTFIGLGLLLLPGLRVVLIQNQR